MTPKVITRGHSFKGVTQYLMHDKGARTSERVDWYETGNIHYTQDPNEAAKVMAWTAKYADEMKTSKAGRKKTAGEVYHYSLSWAHGEKPEAEHMREQALITLDRLGLKDHQFYMVAHNDTDHAHVHIVANLVHPETGRIHSPYKDHDKLSAWALQYEREHGLHCFEREENAQRRALGEHTKYHDEKHRLAEQINRAYQLADNGAAFVHALKAEGLQLAQGRNKLVLVDGQGKTHPLARQLDMDETGRAKTKAVHEKLSDIDLQALEKAEDLARDIRQQKEQTPVQILEEVTKHNAVFDRPALERVIQKRYSDPIERSRAMQSVINHAEFVEMGEKNNCQYYSTKSMIALEKQLVYRAEDMTNAKHRAIDKEHVDTAIQNLNADLAEMTKGKASLSEEQIKGVHHVTDNKRLSLLMGVAGAGKSTILSGAQDAWEKQGLRVRGAALSGIAAQNLQDSGIQSGTLHALEGKIKTAQKILDQNTGRALTEKQQAFVKDSMLTDKDVLVIDEAAMVSAKQLNSVMTLAEQAGAKVVLVGDHEQLQSIEAGSAFRTILERTGAAQLQEVRRQKTAWQQEATRFFAKGQAQEGLSLYEQNGKISHTESREDAKAALVHDYMNAYTHAPEKRQMVLAYTRADVADLNQQIKAEMIKAGRVADKDTDITVTHDDMPLKQGFANGDRIMFRENDKSMGVMNGTLAKITGISKDRISVTLDNGQALEFNPQEYNKFSHGYAATVHKSQGVTVDNAYVLSSRHFNRHSSYVALSRHKDSVRVYAAQDDFKTLDHMKKSMSKEGQNLSTLDFKEPEKEAQKQVTQKEQARRGFMRKWVRGRADRESRKAQEQTAKERVIERYKDYKQEKEQTLKPPEREDMQILKPREYEPLRAPEQKPLTPQKMKDFGRDASNE